MLYSLHVDILYIGLYFDMLTVLTNNACYLPRKTHEMQVQMLRVYVCMLLLGIIKTVDLNIATDIIIIVIIQRTRRHLYIHARNHACTYTVQWNLALSPAYILATAPVYGPTELSRANRVATVQRSLSRLHHDPIHT